MTRKEGKTLLAYSPFTKDTIKLTVSKRFEHVAAHFANQTALTGCGQSWTYASLNRRANRIAHAILDKAKTGIGCVALLVEQSPDMVIAILAILKAGKIYLGVHPGLPAAAQRGILEDAAPELILATPKLAERAFEISADLCQSLILDDIDERYSDMNPKIQIHPEAFSTIFYTSGTTGQPKGVVKRHTALMHRVWLSTQHDRIVPEDRQSLLTHCSFSASESDMFGVLLQGGTLCVFDVASRGLAEFRSWIDEERITLLHPPVLLFRSLLSIIEGNGLFPSVRLVALAGDVVLPEDLEKWKRHFSRSCVLLHRFATAETALLTVARFNHDSVLNSDFVTAGRPVADKSLTIVDENGLAVETGKTGELIVRSRYLSDGYWRHPEETAAVFRCVPNASDERIYRTGDLGRFLPDGSLLFLKRREHLAKIRGYRVDVREVESSIAQLKEVSAAAVVVCKEDDQDRLWAFVVHKPGLTIHVRRLREELQTRLPEWKIPARFESIAALPTLLNGKIDRQFLVRFAHRVNTGQKRKPSDAKGREAPATAIEKVLMDIWRITLNANNVEPEDNFFDLGGNSISAMITLNWIERFYGVRLTPGTFFEHATVRRLAVLLQDKPAVTANGPALEPLSPKDAGSSDEEGLRGSRGNA